MLDFWHSCMHCSKLLARINYLSLVTTIGCDECNQLSLPLESLALPTLLHWTVFLGYCTSMIFSHGLALSFSIGRQGYRKLFTPLQHVIDQAIIRIQIEHRKQGRLPTLCPKLSHADCPYAEVVARRINSLTNTTETFHTSRNLTCKINSHLGEAHCCDLDLSSGAQNCSCEQGSVGCVCNLTANPQKVKCTCTQSGTFVHCTNLPGSTWKGIVRSAHCCGRCSVNSTDPTYIPTMLRVSCCFLATEIPECGCNLISLCPCLSLGDCWADRQMGWKHQRKRGRGWVTLCSLVELIF